jgi:hypothetical protein
VHYLPPPPPSIARGLKTHFVIFGPLKVVHQFYTLIRLLFTIPKFSYILVQVTPLHCNNSDVTAESSLDSHHRPFPTRLYIPLCKARSRLA